MLDKLQGVDNTATAKERRTNRRLRVSSLIYVELDNGNGGIVTSISEGGLTLTMAGTLASSAEGDTPLEMQIQVPGIPGGIAATGQVVWRSKSGKEAGVRFVHLEEKAHQEIKKWISPQAPGSNSKAGQPGLPKMQLPTASARKAHGPRFSFSDVASSRVDTESETPESNFPEPTPEALPEAEAAPLEMKSDAFVDVKKAVASAFESPAFTEDQKKDQKQEVSADQKAPQAQSLREEACQSRPPSSTAERRSHARRPILLFTYAVLGEDNGGLVFNLGEGGLALTAATALHEQHFSKMRVRFPDSEDWIETQGRLAWISDSGKEAGIEFIDLPSDERAKVREWVSQGEPAPDLRQEESAVPPNQNQPAEFPSFVEQVEEEVPTPPPSKAAASFESRRRASIPSRSALFMSGIKGVLARAAVRKRVARIKPPSHPVPVMRPRGQIRRRVLACSGIAALFAIGWIFLQRNYSNEAGGMVTQNIPNTAVPSKPEENKVDVEQPPIVDPSITQPSENVPSQVAAPPEDTTKAATQNPETATNSGLRENALSDKSAARVPDAIAAQDTSSRQERKTTPTYKQNPQAQRNISHAPSHVAENKQIKNRFVFTENRPTPNAEVRSTPNKDLNASAPPLNASPSHSETVPVAGKEMGAPLAQPKQPEIPVTRTGVVTVSFDPFPSIRMPQKEKSKKSRQGKSLQMGHLLVRVDPAYPEEAKQQGIEGAVKVHAIFNRQGVVQNLISVSGPPPLVAAAMKAIGQWRYTPTILGGQAMETEEDVTVQFRLSNGSSKN